MRSKYEIESFTNGVKKKEEAHHYDEAAQFATTALKEGADKVYISEVFEDAYGNRVGKAQRYKYTEAVEEGDSLKDDMSSSDIEDWLDTIESENFIPAGLAMRNLDKENRQELVKLIDEYKIERGTKAVLPIISQIQQLLNVPESNEEIVDEDEQIEVDKDLDIEVEPIEESEEILTEAIKDPYQAFIDSLDSKKHFYSIESGSILEDYGFDSIVSGNINYHLFDDKAPVLKYFSREKNIYKVKIERWKNYKVIFFNHPEAEKFYFYLYEPIQEGWIELSKTKYNSEEEEEI